MGRGGNVPFVCLHLSCVEFRCFAIQNSNIIKGKASNLTNHFSKTRQYLHLQWVRDKAGFDGLLPNAYYLDPNMLRVVHGVDFCSYDV